MDGYSGYRTVPWTGVLATLADPTRSLGQSASRKYRNHFGYSERWSRPGPADHSFLDQLPSPNTREHKAGGRTGKISGREPWREVQLFDDLERRNDLINTSITLLVSCFHCPSGPM